MAREEPFLFLTTFIDVKRGEECQIPVFRAADFCQAGQSQHGQRLVRFCGGHANSATGHNRSLAE